MGSVRPNACKAPQALSLALLEHAPLAGHIFTKDHVSVAVRFPLPPIVSGTEDRDAGLSHRSGDVHRAGVVSEIADGTVAQRRALIETQVAGTIENSPGIHLSHEIAHLALAGAPQQDGTRIAVFGKKGSEDFPIVLDRPTLCRHL